MAGRIGAATPERISRADGLTLIRLGIALAIWVPLRSQTLLPAGLLLALAWITDAADGAIARREGPGRLGAYDLHADTAVGIGVLIGLAGWALPVWTVVGAIVVLGGWFALRGNPAAAMLLQALAYGTFLVEAWQDGVASWSIPTLTALVILGVSHRRFLEVILPSFFHGLGLGRR